MRSGMTDRKEEEGARRAANGDRNCAVATGGPMQAGETRGAVTRGAGTRADDSVTTGDIRVHGIAQVSGQQSGAATSERRLTDPPQHGIPASDRLVVNRIRDASARHGPEPRLGDLPAFIFVIPLVRL